MAVVRADHPLAPLCTNTHTHAYKRAHAVLCSPLSFCMAHDATWLPGTTFGWHCGRLTGNCRRRCRLRCGHAPGRGTSGTPPFTQLTRSAAVCTTLQFHAQHNGVPTDVTVSLSFSGGRYGVWFPQAQATCCCRVSA